MGVIGWIQDQIEDFTGKTERDDILKEMEKMGEKIEKTLENGIEKINTQIENLNENIEKINEFRKYQVKEDLNNLEILLERFGFVDKKMFFTEESIWEDSNFKIDLINNIEDYKQRYELDSSWEILKFFFVGGILLHFKRQKENLKLRAELKKIEIEYEKLKNDLEYQEKFYKENNEITLLYMVCLTEINLTIVNVILPEFELVEAFCQALEIKNKVIAEANIKNINFKNHITALNKTNYDKHYRFIKNAYAFYVISLKMYNTPILTNLFISNSSKLDLDKSKKELKQLREKQKLLKEQENIIRENLMIERVGAYV